MFIVITPIVGMSFPALTPLIFATAGALGYKVMVDMKEGGDLNEALRQQIQETLSVRAKVDDLVLDAMEEEVKRGEMLFFEKDGIKLVIMKDERGKLSITITGPKETDKKALEAAGREFAEELAQMFAANRAAEVVENLGAEIVEEQVNEEGDMIMTVRRNT